MNIEVIAGGGLPELGAFIGGAIASMPPDQGQAMLGAIFANIVGNIPADRWEKIKEASKLPCQCGDPNCGIAVTAVIEAAQKAREQFERVTAGHKPKGDDDETSLQA